MFSAYGPDEPTRSHLEGMLSMYAIQGIPAPESWVPRSDTANGPQPPPSGVQSDAIPCVLPLSTAR
ncbi:MAG TPA: hypothetical protein VIM76_06930 [Candidatus Dormibacteraeota bacterium]